MDKNENDATENKAPGLGLREVVGSILAAGLGVYPGVGVIDCYVAIRQGRQLTSLRTSGSLGDDRMEQRVGSMSVDVEGHRSTGDGARHGKPHAEQGQIGGSRVARTCIPIRRVKTPGWAARAVR